MPYVVLMPKQDRYGFCSRVTSTVQSVLIPTKRLIVEEDEAQTVLRDYFNLIQTLDSIEISARLEFINGPRG